MALELCAALLKFDNEDGARYRYRRYLAVIPDFVRELRELRCKIVLNVYLSLL